MEDSAVELIARDQRRWSITATRLKTSIVRARLLILILAVLGAALETLAAQVHNFRPQSQQAVYLGYTGAAAIAIIAVIRQWGLGSDRLQAWTIARSASESFKRELFFLRTGCGEYSGNGRALVAFDRRDQILAKANTALKFAVEPDSNTNKLQQLDADGYIRERISGQIAWFRSRATLHARSQRVMTAAELTLALLAALLGAGLTMSGRQFYGAWVAVITTIIGAISSHILAQRYEQLMITYRATADRLEGIVGRWKADGSTLEQLVNSCEAALFEENQGWIAGANDMVEGKSRGLRQPTVEDPGTSHPQGSPPK